MRKCASLFGMLSLDVALGCVIFSISLSKTTGVLVPPLVYVTLFLSVWIIYSVDHLLDSNRISHQFISVRHAFHREYFTVIRRAVVMAVLTVFVMLFYVPFVVLLYGFGLVILVLFYFLLINLSKSSFTKEFVAAVLYALGISIPLISMSEVFLIQYGFLIYEIAVLALTNLLIFAYYDRESDKTNGFNSFVVHYGVNIGNRIVWLLLILGLVNVLIGTFFFEKLLLFQVLVFVMTFVLVVIFYFKSFFRINDRFRFWGDAIFFLPSILILFLS